MKGFWNKQEKDTGEKQKKKMSGKKKVLVGIIVILAVVVLASVVKGMNAKQIVTTVAAKKQDIFQTLDTSGTVVSEKNMNYYAPVSAKIGEIRVEKGETVQEGEAVLTYDQDSIGDLKKITELNLAASKGGYQDNMEKNGKQQALYTEASVNLDVLEQQIEDTQAYIDSVQKKLDDKKAELAHFGSLLEISRIEWSNQQDSDEYQNLLILIQQNSYEQQNGKELRELEEEINKHTRILNEYKEYLSEMKSQKSSSESSKLSSSAQTQLTANAEVEALKLENTLDAIAANEQGILAEFNGVVTSMEAVSGKTPQEGELLFTLESLEDVAVSLSVSKYDLEKLKTGQEAKITIAGKTYEGQVGRIEQMATKNANGAAVVGVYLTITNPDQDIFLGVEAKTVISTGEVKDAITIPMEAINTDVGGQFVYVVKDGFLEKRSVETGLSTDLEIQIVSGLEEGEQVVSTSSAELTEGMEVTAVEAQ
ncbi:MAG: efflux RND transporter periplasmic adaptor subunit [Lachnospiraceae bacterium]|nr:efflux RND transporter periplasmic adaptor subunit [Lachnospiraceae bacterium]